MDAEFWLDKWQHNQIGFHKSEANPLLIKHINALALDKGDRIFLPLCGKTLDIGWLIQKGFRIVGAELSELAIEQLFTQLDLEPTIEQLANLRLYSADNIDIFVGDIFDLKQAMIGQVDAIFDRAALVALPEDMRKTYTKHVIDVTSCAPQLLLTFEYGVTDVAGPPHSIHEDEVVAHYGQHYQLQTLELFDIGGGFRGASQAMEHVWHLSRL
ncbi:MAG: thiopurine S-methyltransferase [Rhizobiaceae bacterium]|nr:thiopurine S-methyltransferase [Rhizobiaceae bacterium]